MRWPLGQEAYAQLFLEGKKAFCQGLARCSTRSASSLARVPSKSASLEALCVRQLLPTGKWGNKVPAQLAQALKAIPS